MFVRRFTIPAVLVATAAALGSAAPATSAPATPTLVAVRAAHHPTFDRLVFEFDGALPGHSVTRATKIIGDGSGLPVPVVGSSFLAVRFSPAVGHDDAGKVTYGATRRSYALPAIIQVVNSGDFEAVLSFGVGLSTAAPFSVFTLTNPSRVVIDVKTAFQTVTVKTYFLDQNRFAVGTEPYVRAVTRPVIPPATAKGALQRLFAGPTAGEAATGLRLVTSDATGFSNLSISNGIARVRLVGGCNSHGSTFTVAGEIMPTLKQFSSVTWVKIYDPSGTTENPTGNSDSIPECLEP